MCVFLLQLQKSDCRSSIWLVAQVLPMPSGDDILYLLSFREHVDFIALDQQGIRASEQIPFCLFDYSLSLTKKISSLDVTNRYRQAAIACAAD